MEISKGKLSIQEFKADLTSPLRMKLAQHEHKAKEKENVNW